MTYVDVLHIYSMVRAGYVPQLFTLRMPNPDIIFELLEMSNGKALIYDSSFTSSVMGGPVPTYVARPAEDSPEVLLPPISEGKNGDEILMIFHTSGSTSGRPKLVPCSYEWWDMCLRKGKQCTVPHNPARQDVTVWMYVSSSYAA